MTKLKIFLKIKLKFMWYQLSAKFHLVNLKTLKFMKIHTLFSKYNPTTL